MVRLPEGMRDTIREMAAANNRSMNAEIVSLLEAAIESTRPTRPDEVTHVWEIPMDVSDDAVAKAVGDAITQATRSAIATALKSLGVVPKHTGEDSSGSEE